VSERRKAQRSRTFKGGKIVFNDGRSVIDCTIKNLSPTGAALRIESTIGIPDDFKLVISPDNMTKACRVVWRKEDQIGVAFVAG